MEIGTIVSQLMLDSITSLQRMHRMANFATLQKAFQDHRSTFISHATAAREEFDMQERKNKTVRLSFQGGNLDNHVISLHRKFGYPNGEPSIVWRGSPEDAPGTECLTNLSSPWEYECPYWEVDTTAAEVFEHSAIELENMLIALRPRLGSQFEHLLELLRDNQLAWRSARVRWEYLHLLDRAVRDIGLLAKSANKKLKKRGGDKLEKPVAAILKDSPDITGPEIARRLNAAGEGKYKTTSAGAVYKTKSWQQRPNKKKRHRKK